jgi:Ca2+-binding RTX toxin-like protein
VRPTTTLITTLTGLALVAGATTATVGAAHAAETCFGLAPTIVATDRANVTGTEGDDVIVATGPTRLDALGGDDTVCVEDGWWIDLGDGDDRVLSRKAQERNRVILGSGSDAFFGSGARDRVYADVSDDEGTTQPGGPDDVDTIHTRGGADRVVSGDWSGPNRDRIDLGSGADTVALASAAGGTAEVDGDGGTDTVVADGGADLGYDLAAGTASVGGHRYAALEEFEDVFVQARLESVSVRGTDGPNDIFVTGRVDVDAGGGRDTMTLHGDLESVVGGSGRDHVAIQGYGDYEDIPVVFDLGARTFTRGGDPIAFETESLRVGTTGGVDEPVRVLGSVRRDVVTVGACGAVVLGRGGDDVLRSVAEQCERVPVALHGGAGDDRLRGSVGRDALIGNSGRDRASGGPGRDRCRAEVERSCERD